jgi:hypothetical protein
MRPTKKDRLQLSDRNVLQEWFGFLKTATENVSPANIYNFDETNFQSAEETECNGPFALAMNNLHPRSQSGPTVNGLLPSNVSLLMAG